MGVAVEVVGREQYPCVMNHEEEEEKEVSWLLLLVLVLPILDFLLGAFELLFRNGVLFSGDRNHLFDFRHIVFEHIFDSVLESCC